MSTDFAKLALLRPGMPVSALKAALGDDWKEPSKQDEGRLYLGEFSARITADGLIGEVRFQEPLPLPGPIHGISMGMEDQRFRSLFPDHVRFPCDSEEYGWTKLKIELPEGFDLIVGVKENVVRIIEIRDPKAVYPERPYKYADDTLTQAFDLTLADPVRLDRRPEHGWCFGRPPGIDADRWPISPAYGVPLRHAFTLKLPPPYRTLGDDYVAISLFVDEQWHDLPRIESGEHGDAPLIRGEPLAPSATLGSPSPHFTQGGPLRFDMEDLLGCRHVLVWLTEAELTGPLGTPPDMAGPAHTPVPGWLSKSPLEYFGEFSSLPSTTAEQRRPDNFAPGGYAVDQLLAAAMPKTGWKHLPGREALDFGWPIQIALREGDPNVGKPAREWDQENAFSGYVPAYSDKGEELDLERFTDWHAHLGGTMFPIQGYPDFSPFYIEFGEVFGGFNFGGGVAQLDLKEMELEWAC